ncbi:MAG: SH3 domain-containing protein, partial [Thermomicrobiales bacterium]
GTNGDGVRCRVQADAGSAVITVVPEGSMVDLIGAAADVWQPINCGGQSGFVHAEFVTYDLSGGAAKPAAADPAPQPAVGGVDVTGSATISGTNGDGVRCRSAASANGGVITVLSEGSSVDVRGDPVGGWQAVVCAGSDGFVSSEFIGSATAAPATDAVTAASADMSASASRVGGSATASGTNGDGVRCRSGAGFDASVIVVLGEGTSVSLRGDAQGDWQPVLCGGGDGWIFSTYVGAGGGTSGGGTNGGGDGTPSNSSFASGDVAVVSGTGGSGVQLRSGASFDASIVTVVGEGKTCTVIDGSSGDWVAVSYGGTSGFINMGYLSASSGGGGTSDGGASGGGGGGLADGDHAATSANLNLRYDPSYSSGIAAVAPEATVVKITGNPTSGFYPVDWDGIQGYMLGDFLQFTDAALSVRGGSGNPGSGGNPGGGGGGSNAGGNGIASFAMQYLGYPYIWATHGPSSFDCSGFTYWVVLNTLGLDIGAGTDSQIAVGTPIDQGNLQPGDLVFFQNTYALGLSHVGIYIGGGQFIHAENESTGVVISNLSSDYYASRWYGARRLA